MHCSLAFNRYNMRTESNLSTRHDKKPLTTVDWASIISVCSILGMKRVLDIAFKTLQNAPLNTGRAAGVGFDATRHGLYFLIREKGTTNCLGSYWSSNNEGAQLHLWPRDIGSKEKAQVTHD